MRRNCAASDLPLDAGTALGYRQSGCRRADCRRSTAASTIERGRIANYALSGGGEVRTRGRRRSASAHARRLRGNYARVDGTIGSLMSGSPVYAFDADVPAARVASDAACASAFPNYIDRRNVQRASARGRRGLAPTVGGRVERAGRRGQRACRSSTRARRRWRPTRAVSASTKAPSSSAPPRQVSTRLSRSRARRRSTSTRRTPSSPISTTFSTRATRSTETAACKIAADARAIALTSSGNIDVAGFRYRNLPIGDTQATWASATKRYRSDDLTVGGAEGMLRARGSLGLTPSHDWQTTLTRSRYNLGASVQNLDLSLWVPALGMQSVPITGRASGDATVRGRYPIWTCAANARSSTADDRAADARSRRSSRCTPAGSAFVIDNAAMVTPDLTGNRVRHARPKRRATRSTCACTPRPIALPQLIYP